MLLRDQYFVHAAGLPDAERLHRTVQRIIPEGRSGCIHFQGPG